MTRRKFIYTYSMIDELLASPTEPTPEAARRHQLTKMWSGLANIERAAIPTSNDWRVCSDAVNMMETLVTQGLVEDSGGLLMDAVTALATAGRRSLQGNAIRLDAPGIQAVRAVLEDYATCLDALPHRTMVRCHRATEKRIHEILAGKRQPHDVEFMKL